ncbi:hypothetical protein HNQ60_002532 [Povalibacter uvarum]|uniref:HNH nuclease domain-containing protein n=1 Tax=Povalibacter uvarum TaxID=732238 RepID=A0A841HKB8_9GAMM|nr:HNH endonuclease signature motif containing protein [Povalibacter uvarum]MBB6093651.1 hypothetical protein [Povalibacter uvarum]
MDAAVSLVPTERPLTDLAAEITELTGHLNAANHRWLMLIAEFDRREGWSDWATQSCAHWLNWKCGVDLGAAREKVRVAHALQELPKISEAMQKGQLSYSKVRALTRVADRNTEEYLLQIAMHGTAGHVEKLVRHFRRATEAEELSREVAQQVNRSCTYQWDDDGSLVLKARLPAEAGALVLKALEAALGEIPIEADDPAAEPVDVSAETERCAVTPAFRLSPSVRRADALALVAESFIANGPAALTGGDKHQIVVHVSAETLRDRQAGRCEIEDGAGVSAETCRRLACDCSLVHILEDERGSVLDVGRKTRSIPPALRRALNARDQGCRFPGCCNGKYLDGHHIEHWANGGATKLSNLVSLCHFHHRQVHEGGVLVQILDDGALRFFKPDGESLDSVAPGYSQPLGDWRQLPAHNERSHIRINASTAVTKWQGESMDYGLGVQVLMERGRRERLRDGRGEAC